ncbi:membrane protein [Streptococcus pneumoniae]|nr:membrane protein [Streptococcus pneumoniae]
MSNYRRTSKPKTEHIKKGFTVFQKTVATIASILGLITASITIMNALDNNKNIKKEPTTSQTTTIVKEIQKESPKENTSPTKETNTSQEETPKSSVKEEKKEDQKTATQDSSTPASSKPATENEKQPNTPTSENNTQ